LSLQCFINATDFNINFVAGGHKEVWHRNLREGTRSQSLEPQLPTRGKEKL